MMQGVNSPLDRLRRLSSGQYQQQQAAGGQGPGQQHQQGYY
jgi:hypothetical protein